MSTSCGRFTAAAVPFAVTIALLAAAGPAQAHTWATCMLTDTGGGEARCAGTIADRAISTAPTEGSLVAQGNRALLSIRAWPVLPIFTSGIPVTASLSCVAFPGLIQCSGTGDAGGEPVSVQAAGDGHRTVVTIADDASGDRQQMPSEAAASSQQDRPPRHARPRRHHKPRHHHKPRRHHKPGRHGCHR